MASNTYMIRSGVIAEWKEYDLWQKSPMVIVKCGNVIDDNSEYVKITPVQ